MELLMIVFYLTSGLLAAVCLYVANNMTINTCICIKHSMSLLVCGVGFLVCSVYYSPPDWHRILAILIIFWGLIGWLFFDRYKAHREIAIVKSWVVEQWYCLKEHFLDLVGKK